MNRRGDAAVYKHVAATRHLSSTDSRQPPGDNFAKMSAAALLPKLIDNSARLLLVMLRSFRYKPSVNFFHPPISLVSRLRTFKRALSITESANQV